MQHDVFICHASEDKDELVRPLANALRAQHVDVWYDEFSLRIGDSLRQSIDRGLAGSRYGVVVLSPSFFEKAWTQWELNGLLAKMMHERRQTILPIWHRVGSKEVAQYSLPMADLRSLMSSSGVDSLCSELLSAIRPSVSPLHVAKEELSRFGWNPPPISDEWWLNIVEAQSTWDWPMEDQFWHFPLEIGGKLEGHQRGLSIAWTALQLDWQDDAKNLQICQTTHPDLVLSYINENAALREAASKFPAVVANFAPQLLLPGYSGWLDDAFDELLAQSIHRTRLHPDKRFPDAICERYFALRRQDFGGHSANEVADKWINGRGADESAKFFDYTDYVFWLLSEDSYWMPANVKEFLLTGMRDWGVIRLDVTDKGIWGNEFWRKTLGRTRRQMSWTKPRRADLLEAVSRALKRLRIDGDPERIARAFIELQFFEAIYDQEQSWKRRRAPKENQAS